MPCIFQVEHMLFLLYSVNVGEILYTDCIWNGKPISSAGNKLSLSFSLHFRISFANILLKVFASNEKDWSIIFFSFMSLPRINVLIQHASKYSLLFSSLEKNCKINYFCFLKCLEEFMLESSWIQNSLCGMFLNCRFNIFNKYKYFLLSVSFGGNCILT